jgi:glycosyltransferase involved in cell wall biosynthesis
MKIFYDYQIFSSQRYGGISRYFYEIMKNRDYVLPLFFNNNNYLDRDVSIKINFIGKIRLFNYFNSLYNKFYLLLSKDYDIFHPTYYNPYFLGYNKKPFVLTIHDMIHEKFKEAFHENEQTSIRKKLLANEANKIIAVSKKTKEDIIEILNIPSKKIKVIYHGSNFDFIRCDDEIKKLLPSRYILFTGNRNGYKNFKNLIYALKSFLLNDSGLFLICVGGTAFTSEEKNIFKELKINNNVLRFSCNDRQLKTLYTNSLFFIFPSLYEGFGIPLLEAMASATPILCSNTGCFPEIARDCAIYFNPYDVEDIQKKIRFAFNHDLMIYVKKGKKRFKDFSWDKAREKTMQLYEEVISDCKCETKIE